MSRWNHPDGPRDYTEVGYGAPQPVDTDTLCMFCRAPDPEHETWCDAHPSDLARAERAYHAAEDGHPCPVCEEPKPYHPAGCWMRAEGEPSYRLTPDDFQEF